jgi:hypothetical protein
VQGAELVLAVGLPLGFRFVEPLGSLRDVLRYPRPLDLKDADAALRDRAVLLRNLAERLERFGGGAVLHVTFKEHDARVEWRQRATMLRCLQVPLPRFRGLPRNAVTIGIQVFQVELRVRMALSGAFAIPFQGSGGVPRNACAVLTGVAGTRSGLRGTSVLGGFQRGDGVFRGSG